MPARSILLAGWEGDVPDLGGLPMRRVPVSQVLNLLRPRTATFVVALGDLAVRTLSPQAFGLALQRTLALAVLCPKGFCRTSLGPWKEIAPVADVTGGSLYATLFEAVHVPVRLSVPRSDWLPRGALRDPFMEVFAGVVEASDQPSVKEAAQRLGRSRFQLDRMCMKKCGVGPKGLMGHYIASSFQAERIAGRTIDQAAVALGYSDRSSLLRALRKVKGPEPLNFTRNIGP